AVQPSAGGAYGRRGELGFGCAVGGVGRGGPLVGRGGAVAHPTGPRISGGPAHAGVAADLLVGCAVAGPGRRPDLRSVRAPVQRQFGKTAVSSRRRVTAALVGLLMLVAGGWVSHHALADPPTGGRPVAVASTSGLQVRGLSQLP